MLENIENLETYIKVLIGFIGAIAAFGKLRESFASIRRKQELKLDLEILEKLKSNSSILIPEIEKKINLQLEKAFENGNENLTNFFTGMAAFVGFGFWSIDIFRNSDGFSGWIILTLLFSLIGLSLVLGNNEKKEKKEMFYQIGFFDKSNFQAGLIITGLTGILTPILILKIDGFSFWQFLSGFIFLVGIASIFKTIKPIKN